jgi:hypothetical protein
LTHATRRLVVATLAVLALAAAACDASSAIATPSASASPSPAAASVAPSAPASVAVTTPAPAATGTSAPSVACAVTPQTGNLPSDRFIDIRVSPGVSADALTFVFGDPSLPGPPGTPKGSLEIAEPPYTLAASGQPIQVNGEHVLQIRFSGMSLSNDVGQETYVGPRGIEEPFPALRHAVIYDMSEGVVGWYVGYDGEGCVTLTQTSNEVTLTIQHP